jgi:hypothetical protein
MELKILGSMDKSPSLELPLSYWDDVLCEVYSKQQSAVKQNTRMAGHAA